MTSPLPPFRIGIGYDIHPLLQGRPCILGGVHIPSDVGPAGHSDADVVLHAVADAILGAAGLRDIGFYFPNTDATNKGLDSSAIVRKSVAEAHSHGGWSVCNVDVVVIAERPKLSVHIQQMKIKLAEIIGITPEQIGIKATTNEGMDSIGQGQAIAVQAVCLVFRD